MPATERFCHSGAAFASKLESARALGIAQRRDAGLEQIDALESAGCSAGPQYSLHDWGIAHHCKQPSAWTETFEEDVGQQWRRAR